MCLSFLLITFFSHSSELAARLQEAENAAAEEERQEGESAGGHGEAQGQAIGPRSNKDKKVVETLFFKFIFMLLMQCVIL